MSEKKVSTDWLETHYEVSVRISAESCRPTPPILIEDIENDEGTGGLYELAEKLTNEFQIKYENYNFDGDYFDKLEEFFNEKFSL